jgi:hypothetical protein
MQIIKTKKRRQAATEKGITEPTPAIARRSSAKWRMSDVAIFISYRTRLDGVHRIYVMRFFKSQTG